MQHMHTHTRQWPDALKPNSYSLVKGNQTITLMSQYIHLASIHKKWNWRNALWEDLNTLSIVYLPQYVKAEMFTNLKFHMQKRTNIFAMWDVITNFVQAPSMPIKQKQTKKKRYILQHENFKDHELHLHILMYIYFWLPKLKCILAMTILMSVCLFQCVHFLHRVNEKLSKLNRRGNSDLVWTGLVCCSSLINPYSSLRVILAEEGTSLLRIFLEKRSIFHKFCDFGVFRHTKTWKLGSVRNLDPCLRIFL